MVVTYNSELGWTLENLSEGSGTWLHPKTYTEALMPDKSNSVPVRMRPEMIIKAHTYTFKFTRP